MRQPADQKERTLEWISFGVLITGVSFLFALSVWPFVGAILWSVVAGVMFAPLKRWLEARLGGRGGWAAGLTLLIIAAAVILPTLVLAGVIADKATSLYSRFASGQIDPGAWFRQVYDVLPTWATSLFERLGLTSFGDFRSRFGSSLSSGFQTLASQAFTLSQGAFGFVVALGVMLYLTFFLLRDGEHLSRKIGEAVPLLPQERHVLARRFVSVVRATVKGSVAVAVVQGAAGGLLFWLLGVSEALLWGVLMAFCALLPAVGSALIWVPVSLYLLATGDVWQGVVLILAGVFLIGMIDNVLRPVMVGGETRMPDYVVLITTLGGLEIFGFNGLLIGPLAAALFISTWNMLSHWRRPDAER